MNIIHYAAEANVLCDKVEKKVYFIRPEEWPHSVKQQ